MTECRIFFWKIRACSSFRDLVLKEFSGNSRRLEICKTIEAIVAEHPSLTDNKICLCLKFEPARVLASLCLGKPARVFPKSLELLTAIIKAISSISY